MEFPERCQSCQANVVCKMKLVKIPFFKEVTLMAVCCDECGFRSNEVKAGGCIEPKGKRIELTINCKEDLARDVLKSDTARYDVRKFYEKRVPLHNAGYQNLSTSTGRFIAYPIVVLT